MSVRVLGFSELDRLVAAARHAGLADSQGSSDWLGHTLLRANLNAYLQRYEPSGPSEAIPNEPLYRYQCVGLPNLPELYKLLSDYIYNAEDWVRWPGSEAENIVETLINVFFPLAGPACLQTASGPT